MLIVPKCCIDEGRIIADVGMYLQRIERDLHRVAGRPTYVVCTDTVDQRACTNYSYQRGVLLRGSFAKLMVFTKAQTISVIER